jgi:putative membrane protein
MRIRKTLGVISCAAMLCAATATYAQSASDADKDFTKKAMEGGNGEVQLGTLAQQKSNSEDVKHFGETMVTDHGKMNADMAPIAKSLGVDPPTGTTMAAKAEEAKLKMMSGDSFDKAYIKAMVEDHREDLAEFKKVAATATDPQLKKAAQHGVTVISEHLRMAEKMAQDHNVDVASN